MNIYDVFHVTEISQELAGYVVVNAMSIVNCQMSLDNTDLILAWSTARSFAGSSLRFSRISSRPRIGAVNRHHNACFFLNLVGKKYDNFVRSCKSDNGEYWPNNVILLAITCNLSHKPILPHGLAEKVNDLPARPGVSANETRTITISCRWATDVC